MERNYADEIVKRSHLLRDKKDLAPLMERIKDKKVVMLGEASHGTSEYYQWRKEISLDLIQNHGFDFIAVEGDWPACQEVNRFVQLKEEGEASQFLQSFSRWPTWMWANTDVAHLIEDLREINRPLEKKAGFYGLDVYSLFDSIGMVLVKLRAIDPHLAKKAADLYECFEPFRQNEKEYARSLFRFPKGCEQEAAEVLKNLLEQKISLSSNEEFFDSLQNARIVQNAEKYYRAMISVDDDSWNVRDRHMMSTLDILMQHYGPDAKGIVWEHNTHIGDYRATDMVLQGHVNIGGLAREAYGEDNVSLVGFGSYSGSVIASNAWDGDVFEMPVPASPEGTIESILHNLTSKIGSSDYFILFDQNEESVLNDYKGHRAIGVIYHPSYERGNYVPTALAKRYDAFIYLDQTTALTPYKVSFRHQKIPETYPFGARV